MTFDYSNMLLHAQNTSSSEHVRAAEARSGGTYQDRWKLSRAGSRLDGMTDRVLIPVDILAVALSPVRV
jgi:hypothetical protein